MSTINSLTDDEVSDLLNEINLNKNPGKSLTDSYRNYCMALMMLDAGLRVGELVQLRQSDLYFHGCIVSQLVIRAEISKTKTERTIPISQRLTVAIQILKTQVWLKDGALLNHYAFYCNNFDKHITSRQVERIVLHAGHVALNRRVTPHMLRHTFGTRVLRKSNMRVTQELLGHRRISSTQIYTHPNNQDKKDAIDGLAC